MQGTYPVIAMSFARVKEANYKATRDKICEILRNLYIKYAFIRESDRLLDADRDYFDRILAVDVNDVDVTSALYQLSDFLHRYYGKKVIILLDECGLSDQKEKVKLWYDGFTFGSHTDIYNPWSAINYLDTGKVGIYWTNTSANSLASKLIRQGGRRVKESFGLLLKGESIRCQIDEQIVYNQFADNEAAIWSLLLASGYLKVLDYRLVDEDSAETASMYELTLTNREVRCMFYNMVRGWFARVGGDFYGGEIIMSRESEKILRELHKYMEQNASEDMDEMQMNALVQEFTQMMTV